MLDTFLSPDGLAIAYRRWGTPNERPPVLLQHGFAVDSQLNWVHTGVVEGLLADGRFVIAADARGHGRSAAPHDSSFYGEERMALDLRALIDHLRLELVDLAGYSMGAVISLVVASSDTRIRRLAIGGVGEGVLACGGVDTRALHNGDLSAALRAKDPATIREATLRSFRTLADATGADRLALAAQADSVLTTTPDLCLITSPTLLIAGDDDPLAVEPEKLVAALPNATLHRVPGDHLAAVAHPSFRNALIDFLGAREPGC